MGRCEGQCAPQKTRYIPRILQNNQSLLVLEDILSIFLLLSQLSFHKFLFQNLQNWALDGKISSSYFSTSTLDAGSWIPTRYIPSILWNNQPLELWMLALDSHFYPFPFLSQVSIPKPALVNFGWQDQLFLLLYIHVPFKKFLVNSSRMNFGWERWGKGSVHHKYTLHSKHPLKQSVSSVLEDILSIVLRSQLS